MRIPIRSIAFGPEDPRDDVALIDACTLGRIPGVTRHAENQSVDSIGMQNLGDLVHYSIGPRDIEELCTMGRKAAEGIPLRHDPDGLGPTIMDSQYIAWNLGEILGCAADSLLGPQVDSAGAMARAVALIEGLHVLLTKTEVATCYQEDTNGGRPAVFVEETTQGDGRILAGVFRRYGFPVVTLSPFPLEVERMTPRFLASASGGVGRGFPWLKQREEYLAALATAPWVRFFGQAGGPKEREQILGRVNKGRFRRWVLHIGSAHASPDIAEAGLYDEEVPRIVSDALGLNARATSYHYLSRDPLVRTTAGVCTLDAAHAFQSAQMIPQSLHGNRELLTLIAAHPPALVVTVNSPDAIAFLESVPVVTLAPAFYDVSGATYKGLHPHQNYNEVRRRFLAHCFLRWLCEEATLIEAWGEDEARVLSLEGRAYRGFNYARGRDYE